LEGRIRAAGRLVDVVDEQLDPLRADAHIASLAAGQHGVVSWRQLIDAGLGRGAIAHRSRSGWLHRLYRGVFAIGHPPLSREAWWMAAVLSCGEHAALSHTSGLAHWDLRASSDPNIDITIATRNGLASRDRIRIHRSGTVTEVETTTHRAIPVTTVARTLLDSAAGLTPSALTRAVERSEILGLFDLAAVQSTMHLHPTHPGARRLTTILDLYRDDGPTRSELEAMFLALCDAHDLPRPLVNHTVAGEEVDFLWPQHRLVVETDGRRTHLTRHAFERDRARDAKLTIAGYRVVRFTYRHIRDDPQGVAEIVHALLRSPTR
jgi:hypothetical protein